MTHDDDLRPPEKTTADYALTGAKLGISALVPVLGAATVQAIEEIFGSPYERKLAVWRATIAEAIGELRSDIAGLRDEFLKTDCIFQQTVIIASEVASQSDPAETFPLLRRALVAAGNDGNPSRDLICRLLTAVKSLAPTHIRIFRYLAKNTFWDDEVDRLYASARQDNRPNRLSEKTLELAAKAARYSAYYGICKTGLPCFDIPPSDTTIFIQDLIREGLLAQGGDCKDGRSPLTSFGELFLRTYISPSG